MRRWLGWIAIGWMVLLCALALTAYGSPASRPTLDDRVRGVAQQLRCPVCQGESVADSSSGISIAMRRIIRQHLVAGQNPETIKSYFVSKYGTWILLAPPSSGVGRFAWLAPPLLVIGGMGLLVMLVFDWRKKGERSTPLGRAEYLERVRRELESDTGA